MQAVSRTKTFEFGQKNSQAHMPTAHQTESTNRAPIKKIRAGALQVSVWENETLTEDGQVRAFRTVSFERSYKDKNGEWKHTNNLRINDLPKVALLMNKAYEYLILTGDDEEEQRY